MESEVRVRTFSEVFAGQKVEFYILCMKRSFLLWAGVDGSFSTLSVAMNTRFESDPVSTNLLGDSINAASSSLSKRLAKRTGCQCFVSLNIKDPTLCKLAEEHIIRLYERDPHLFFIP
ncbi:Proteasome assembly chaperone 4 [Geodia barretti]|uniref:Proteasome assembly chaperone 4 n=1 Tax=Geodia barretti TaxID=519541 RepID=A0AA35SPH6_GEOBA|nr:Proteasome assembly chaperone 4 [Geodia barretti]